MTGSFPSGYPRPSAERALLDRRIILLSGRIDHQRASDAAATMMTLDALGDDPVELRLNADSDSLDVAFALIDTIDVLAVQVNATVASTVGGTMAGVLAVCSHRRIGTLGRIHLREPTADCDVPIRAATSVWDIPTAMRRATRASPSARRRRAMSPKPGR